MFPSLDLAVRDALAAAEGPAIAADGAWLDFDWLRAKAAALTAALDRLGVGRGEAVGLVARNRPAHVAAIAALIAGRFTIVMVHAALGPAALADEIARLDVRAILADEQDWSDAAREAATAAKLPGLMLGDGGVTPANGVGEARPATSRADVCVELLSSGTTGTPKRVPLSWGAVTEAVADAAGVYASGGPAEAPAIVAHPIATVSGVSFLFPALAHGRPIVLLEKFRLEPWVEAIRKYRPARVSVPPAALAMLLDADVPRADLASLVSVGVGGGRLDPDVQSRFEEAYGVPVLPGYGATEFGGVIANWSLDLHRAFGEAKRGSAGRARPGVTLRILDRESHAPLGPDETGLLEAIVPRMGPAPIVTTDLARIDADGFLFLEGRADMAINRGGFTIRPDEVADTLRSHPDVADIVIFGQADPRLGEVPVGLYETNRSTRLAEAKLIAFARDRLARYQVPVRLVRVAALPRTATFKISVPESRALFDTLTHQAKPAA